MSAHSAYPVVKHALVERLRARTGLAGVNILGHVPVDRTDLVTPSGLMEMIYGTGFSGTFADVVLCAGNLRFDETGTVEFVVEVVGRDSGDDQRQADDRANELVYEILADVSEQGDWDKAALGLDVFDYVFFTPATQAWAQGRVEGTSAYAASCTLGIEVRARRSFA